MVCFFLGHRDAGRQLMPQLEMEVERHITQLNVTEFVVGRYGDFDRMARMAVLEAQKRHPEVRLLVLLPYHPAERPVSGDLRCDGTIYPPGMESVPRQVAIVRANRYVLDHCAYLIAYSWKPASNTGKLLEYARRRPELTITELK